MEEQQKWEGGCNDYVIMVGTHGRLWSGRVGDKVDGWVIVLRWEGG